MPSCRSCNAPIYWMRTPENKSMPFDGSPLDEGTWIFLDGVRCRPMTNVELADPEFALNQRWLPHWASCPDADEWHKKAATKSPKPTNPPERNLFDATLDNTW